MLEPIEVRSYGTEGPRVVVLHGGPGAQGSAIGLAQELQDRFRVIEPIQRRSGIVPLTVQQHVEDLAAVAPVPATVVGWSWGAMLALSFAARYPERVRAIALIGCGTYDPASRAAFHKSMQERLESPKYRTLDALMAKLQAERDPRERDRLYTEMGELSMKAQSFDPLEPIPNAMTADAAGYLETWQDVLRLQREGREPAAFLSIRCPVIMLHGEDDPHPGLSTRDVLRKVIPQLEFVGFARCGHEPWRERHAREVFLRTLRDWLGGVAAPH